MDFYYKKFLESISLSATQVEDGRKKYRGVCDCLAHGFYERDLKDSDKILFGSFKTKTQVLPMGCNQDVDVVFKISEEIFEKYKTRPGDMLQKVRSILKGKYTTTDKISAWGKVVLVDFCEGCHDVEVAPCFQQEDGTFLIPDNYENDVDWELFDVRGQISDFETSNNASNGLTRELVKLIKKWEHYTDIEKETNFKFANISKNLRNTSKSAYNYIWKFNYQRTNFSFNSGFFSIVGGIIKSNCPFSLTYL